MPYVSGFDRDQLMCCSWDAFVEEESIARIIDAFVEHLDIKKLGVKTAAIEGRPSYDPKSIYKLYIYGSRKGIRSPRNLLDRPCITKPKRFRNRTVSSGEDIKNLMETFRVYTVRKLLSSLYIGDFKERIVLHPVSNSLLIKFMGKQVMSVHIKLKPERRPCRNTEIAETEFPVNKIEIVMKALTLIKL